MGEKVMIVDDEAGVRQIMERALHGGGHETVSCASAEEALEAVEKEAPAVVVADIVLPGMSGLELARRVKEVRDVDVIVVTGYVENHSYAEAMQKGASDFIIKPVRPDELVLRLERVLEARHLRQSRDRVLQELQELVIADSLTGLHNSRHFFNQLNVEIGRASRYERNLSLLMLDIDRFKDYNDSYGHLAGDEVLSRIGGIIRSCLREMDSAYRYGGEEFTVLLPEAGMASAVVVANRIRETVESEKMRPEPDLCVTLTVSIGVTEYSPGEEPAAFVKRADGAMYTSKKRGRNAVSSLPPSSGGVGLNSDAQARKNRGR